MESNIDRTVIPGASYHIYEGAPMKDSPITRMPGGVSGGSKMVTFYNANGDDITTIEHNFMFPVMDDKLDQTAPKPKPVSYRRIWWPAFQIGFGMTKGQPGYAVLFHDKNDIRIGWIRISSPDDNISTCQKYDLTDAVEEPSDFSLKPMGQQSGYCTLF